MFRAMKLSRWFSVVRLLLVLASLIVFSTQDGLLIPAIAQNQSFFLPLVSDVSNTVSGAMLADLSGTGTNFQPNKLAWPGLKVHMVNTANGVAGPQVVTGADGKFTLPPQPPAAYKLCRQAPGQPEVCDNTPIQLGQDPITLPDTLIPVTILLEGQITLSNGNPCSFQDATFGVNISTGLRLLAAGSQEVVTPFKVNPDGQYVLVLPDAQPYTIQASCAGDILSQAVQLNTGVMTVDLHIPDAPPNVLALYTLNRGLPVQPASLNTLTTAPSATIDLVAQAEGAPGEALHYQWSDGTAGFQSQDAQSVRWTAGSNAGNATIHLGVTNSHGLPAFKDFTVSVASDPSYTTTFDGLVDVVSGGVLTPVASAVVDIGGASTTSAADGSFSLPVSVFASRIDLTIRKVGFATYQKAFASTIHTAQFVLTPAFSQTVDPTQPIDVIETTSRAGGGTRVQIPANSLVGAGNHLPSGPLTLYVSTVDLTADNNTWPGDDLGMNAGNAMVGIQPYTGVEVYAVDSAGSAFDLASGQTARLSIPLNPLQLNPPAGLTAWTFSGGFFHPVESAALSGASYVVNAAHLGGRYIADVRSAAPDCMRLYRTDTPLAAYFAAQFPTGNGIVRTYNSAISSGVALLPGLPLNSYVDISASDAFGAIDLTLKQRVNTSAAAASILPNFPYSACKPEAVLLVAGDPQTHFLARDGRLLDTDTSATQYYGAIDPGNQKKFFNGINSWKATNGMAPDPDANHDGNAFNDDAATGEVSAVYENAGDLGFGRAMHAKEIRDPNTHAVVSIAYYVCNYPTLDDAINNTHLVACVTMDYSPVPPGTTYFTKFYIFDAAGDRINSVPLDTHGAKNLPALCLVCHGGHFAGGGPAFNPATDSTDLGAQFLPFDLDNLAFSTRPGFTRADQEDKFRKLNAMVLDTNPLPDLKTLIAGWYGGDPANLAGTQNSLFVPPGWTGTTQQNLYLGVVKPYCRTCHIAQNARSFATFANLTANDVQYSACIAVRMPNSEVTFQHFYNDPLVLAFLSTAGLNAGGVTDWPPGKTCPQP